MAMRRGFLRDACAPYPAPGSRLDRVLSTKRDAPTSTATKYNLKELRAWGRNNIQLSDDAFMSAKVDLGELGASQCLVFRNIRVGDTEVSTLLDFQVLRLLPTRFSPPPAALENAIEFRSAGKTGTGVFATQDIRAASIILAEYPTTVIQNTLVLNFGMTQGEVYRELVRRVPESVLPALLQLHDAQPAGTYDPEEALIRSNALGITLPAPSAPVPAAMGHSGVFLQASRLNHSCAPNIIARFDTQSFALILRAVRPISKGEELVLSYIDLGAAVTRAERRARLRRLYHFECLCKQCCAHLTPTAELESDARRERIFATTRTTAFVHLTAWHQQRGGGALDLQQVVAFHLAAVAEMVAEGLHGYAYFLHSAALAICYAALEDVRGFRAWMSRAREFALCNMVTESAVEMLRGIVYPETFTWWGAARTQECAGAGEWCASVILFPD